MASAAAAMSSACRPAAAVRPGVATSRQHLQGTAAPQLRAVRRLRRTASPVAARAMLPGADLLDQLAAHATPLFNLADLAEATSAIEEPVRQTGPLTPLANAMEGVLQALDSGLEAANVPYSYGFAIILLTLMVKAATFPLTKKQMDSTNAMQALAPRVKELQERYKGDQERLQMETANLYKAAGVNPLAGCLPTLATIPVFIGLYRALSNAADDGLLTEGFFWIPSLGGPTTIAARNAGSGSNWLFPFVDGHPPIGWHDAGSYLVLPVLLVVSQFASQKIMQPGGAKSEDPAQQQTQAILKFLPLMIGYFSLNVPSGLTLYWITNNILTTAQSVYLRRNQPAVVETMASEVPMGATTIVKEDVKPKKSTKGKETGARRKKGDKFKQLKEAEKAQKASAAGAAAKAAEIATESVEAVSKADVEN